MIDLGFLVIGFINNKLMTLFNLSGLVFYLI